MLTAEVSRAAAVNATDDYTERETRRDTLISLDGKLETIRPRPTPPPLRATLRLSRAEFHAQRQSLTIKPG